MCKSAKNTDPARYIMDEERGGGGVVVAMLFSGFSPPFLFSAFHQDFCKLCQKLRGPNPPFFATVKVKLNPIPLTQKAILLQNPEQNPPWKLNLPSVPLLHLCALFREGLQPPCVLLPPPGGLGQPLLGLPEPPRGLRGLGGQPRHLGRRRFQALPQSRVLLPGLCGKMRERGTKYEFLAVFIFAQGCFSQFPACRRS